MPAVEANTLPGAYVRELVELARRWDVAPEQLLAGSNLAADRLAEPSLRVPIAVCADIAERARAATGQPALAVYLGLHMRLSSHGYLGFAAMTAATLREAIALATRFAATRSSVVELVHYVEGNSASVVLEERADLDAAREFMLLSLVVGLWQLGQALVGKPLTGYAELSFARPDYLRDELFAAGPVRFGCSRTRLVFPSSYLDLAIGTADPVAAQLVRAQCERELAAIAFGGLPGRVRACLAAQEGGTPSLVTVAKQLHLSERTLKRKLADHGTSFSQLVRQVRHQRALLLLDHRDLSIEQVAVQVGYTEVPNFIRAFRRWTGITPSAYRYDRGGGS